MWWRLELILLFLGSIETLDQTAVISTAPNNSTQCVACALCEACPSCTSSIILAVAITAIGTALLLASIYVPVLVAVFKSYSKVMPDIKTAPSVGGENKVHEQVDEDLAREGGQGSSSGGGGDKENRVE